MGWRNKHYHSREWGKAPAPGTILDRDGIKSNCTQPGCEKEHPAITKATCSCRRLFSFLEVCKLTAHHVLCLPHLESIFCSLSNPMWIPTLLASIHLHTHRSLMRAPEKKSTVMGGIKFCVLWWEWVRRVLKQAGSRPWSWESRWWKNPVTEEKGKNQSRHKLC